jgi:hypothetical protein
MLPIRHSVLSWMSLAGILLVLTCYLPVVKGFGHKHHPNHHHLHHRRASDKALLHNATTSGNGKGSSIDATLAAKMIAQAHEAMAVANRLRLENIQYNRYEFLNSTSAQRSSTPAPPLDYTAVTSNRTVYQRNNHANSSYTNSTSYSYTIPRELAEAARIVAEASPPAPSDSNYAEVAANIKLKYRRTVNDTNAMPQVGLASLR